MDALLPPFLVPVIVPVLIFLAEMTVVTLGTLRIIVVSRGHKFLAPSLGFFEITIWLFAVTQVMQRLDNAWCFLAFAAGFSAGNFFGILIEKSLAMGLAQVSIVSPRDPDELIAELRARDFGVTCMTGSGSQGPVQILFTVVQRRMLPQVLAVLKEKHPDAFYAVDEVTSVSQGIFPYTARRRRVQYQNV